MTTKSQMESWFASAEGRAMNPDGSYGLQCKDVADDYCISIFGNWRDTVRPGNGIDVFANANPAFFIKIANDLNNPNQIPERGDIINWGWSTAVPEGHVAVVASATSDNITVIMQDGYGQYAAKIVTLPYLLPNGAMVVGWLRPKWEAESVPVETLLPNQRITVSVGSRYRDAPNTLANVREVFQGGYTYDFKGFVHGENVGGSDIWFVGKYTGGYSHCSGYTDQSTNGLSDLTPAPAPIAPPIVVIPDPTPVVEEVAKMFAADSGLVTEVVPSKNFVLYSIDPIYICIHQWDDKAKKPSYAGVIKGFVEGDVAPHYVIDDKHTTQVVLEGNRAQHAGPNGNGVSIGIECDPNGGEAMYARIRALVADIRKRKNKVLAIVGHNKFMNTDCPKCIDLSKCEPYAPVVETPVIVTPPEDADIPVPISLEDKPITTVKINRFAWIIAVINWIINKVIRRK